MLAVMKLHMLALTGKDHQIRRLVIGFIEIAVMDDMIGLKRKVLRR